MARAGSGSARPPCRWCYAGSLCTRRGKLPWRACGSVWFKPKGAGSKKHSTYLEETGVFTGTPETAGGWAKPARFSPSQRITASLWKTRERAGRGLEWEQPQVKTGHVIYPPLNMRAHTSSHSQATLSTGSKRGLSQIKWRLNKKKVHKTRVVLLCVRLNMELTKMLHFMEEFETNA